MDFTVLAGRPEKPARATVPCGLGGASTCGRAEWTRGFVIVDSPLAGLSVWHCSIRRICV